MFSLRYCDEDQAVERGIGGSCRPEEGVLAIVHARMRADLEACKGASPA